VFFHQTGEVRWNFHGTIAPISPKLNANRVADLFASLFPNGLQDALHGLCTRARHQGACVGEVFEDGLDCDTAFQAELNFNIMRKPNEGAASSPTFDHRSKGIFLHSSHYRRRRGKLAAPRRIVANIVI
jgi:hypothetical protein